MNPYLAFILGFLTAYATSLTAYYLSLRSARKRTTKQHPKNGTQP